MKARDSVRERGLLSLESRDHLQCYLLVGEQWCSVFMMVARVPARLFLEVSLPLAQNDRLSDLYVPTCSAVNSTRCALLMT